MSVRAETVVTARDSSFLSCVGVSWPLLLGVAGFLVVASLGLGLADPDVYLHVAAGRWMAAHAQVPLHDPFSFTMAAAPWVAQEWGAELLSLLLYRCAGWSGLIFFGAGCFGVTLAYLMRFLLRRMEALHALLLSSLAAGMMLPYMIDRPHAFVWPLTAIWVGGLVRAGEEQRAPSWWLLGVMLLWVNMHASFILGLGLMTLLALDSIEQGKGDRAGIAGRWMPFCAAAFACSLINPQGYRLLLYPFHVLGVTEMLTHFKDWQPPNMQNLQVFDIWIVVIVGAAFAGRVRLSIARAIMLLGLLYMALESNRNVSLLGLISPFLLARPVARHWKQASPSGKAANRLDSIFNDLSRPARPLIACMVLAVAGVAGAAVIRAEGRMPPPIFSPRAALQAVLSRVSRPRILNDPNFGDYLIFRGVPVFVDARAEMYGEAFLKRTLEAMSLAPGGNLHALLVKYRINAIVLWPGEPVVRLLNRQPDWRRVYQDKWSVAYIRRGAHTS